MRRPILFYTIIYAWGQLASYFAAERSSFFLFPIWLASAAAAGSVMHQGSGKNIRRGGSAAAKAAAVFLAGAVLMSLQTARLDTGLETGYCEQGRYVVRVTGVRPSATGYYVDCVGISACGVSDGATGRFRRADLKVRLSRQAYSGGQDAAADMYSLIGKTVEIKAEIELPASAGNPRTFDYRRYLWGRGISLIGKLLSMPGEEDVRDGGSLLSEVRRQISLGRHTFLERLKSGDDRAFAAGVLFGDTSYMDEDELTEFRENGTAHILAVSGLHIGAIASLLTRLRKRSGSGWTVVPCALLLLIYGEASCWSPSVVRAVMLAVVRMAADVTDRPYDSTESAAAVCFFILSKDPYMLFDPGFQMSFLALLSINFLFPYFRTRLGRGLAVTFSVQTVLTPYTALVYNVFSPLGIILNIPMVFLASVYAPIGAAGFFAELFAGRPAPAPAVLSGLGRLIRTVNHVFYLGNPAVRHVVSPPLWAAALLLGAVFLLASEWGEVFLRERKSIKMIMLCAGILLLVTLSAWVIGRSPFDKADLVFIDVGQGDSLHVKSGRSTDMLIDGGGSTFRNVGRDTLMPYLLHNGVRDIDLALATHLHTDHFLGLEQLAEVYPVKEMVTRGLAGDEIDAEGVRIRILWPTQGNEDSPDENYSSLVFMVEMEGIRTLVTGDLTEEGEKALLAMYDGTDELKCDVLKVAHHGSRFSSTDEFLDAAAPRIAVIGVGRNEYGHPAPSVIEKLEAKGIMVYRTDLDGAVGIIISEGSIRVCTGRSTRTDVFSTTSRPAE